MMIMPIYYGLQREDAEKIALAIQKTNIKDGFLDIKEIVKDLELSQYFREEQIYSSFDKINEALQEIAGEDGACKIVGFRFHGSFIINKPE